MSNWRLTPPPGDDLVGCEVVEIPSIRHVAARSLGIGIAVEHGIQAEIIEIRKRKASAGVKESIGRKVVDVDTAVSIIGIKPNTRGLSPSGRSNAGQRGWRKNSGRNTKQTFG